MNHSHTIKLDAAHREYHRAQEACPHWDYENGPERHDCCNRYVKAAREYRKLLKLVKNTPSAQ